MSTLKKFELLKQHCHDGKLYQAGTVIEAPSELEDFLTKPITQDGKPARDSNNKEIIIARLYVPTEAPAEVPAKKK